MTAGLLVVLTADAFAVFVWVVIVVVGWTPPPQDETRHSSVTRSGLERVTPQ